MNRGGSQRLLIFPAPLLALLAAGCSRAPSVWVERNDGLQVAAGGAVRLVGETHNGSIKIQ